MFSLVRFDNEEYYITRSRRVDVVQSNNCLVKYKSGTKYSAQLIETADSEDQLRKLQLRLEAEHSHTKAFDTTQASTQNVKQKIRLKSKLKGIWCSTPINKSIPPFESQITPSNTLSTLNNRSSIELEHEKLKLIGNQDANDAAGHNQHKGKEQSIIIAQDDGDDDDCNNNNSQEHRMNNNQDDTDVDGGNKHDSEEHKMNNNQDDTDDDGGNEHDSEEHGMSDNQGDGNDDGRNKHDSEKQRMINNQEDGDNEGKNECNSEEQKMVDQENNNNDNEETQQIINDQPDSDYEGYNQNYSEERRIIADQDDNDDGHNQHDSEEQRMIIHHDDDNDEGQHSCEEQDIIMGEDDSDDEGQKDSDYIPEQSTGTITGISQISRAHSTRNSSKSFKNLPPVNGSKLNVPCSKVLNKRTTKKYFCPYCNVLQTKFARHLELKHKSEPDVQKFIKFPKGNYERSKIIETIRKRGNFLHNTDSTLNTGILIPCRQPQQKYKNCADDYICCANCKGFFSKKTIRLHSSKCNMSHKKGVRDITIMGRKMAGYIHECASEVLQKSVFPVMRDDLIVRSIKYDKLIILYGNKIAEKCTRPHQYDMVRAQLRLLGRFKCALKKINKEVDDFASVFQPQFYDSVIRAVRECAQYNPVIQSFQTPAVATNLGTMLKKCARQHTAECIKSQDYEGKKAAEEFLVLFDDDFGTSINKKVTEDQTRQRRQKKIILPSKEDIQKLHTFLKDNCKKSVDVLEKHFDNSAWKNLIESTLILIQIFNRRRAGEIERLLISDFENQETIDQSVNPEIYQNLSKASREYAKKFVRLSIRGKLGRTVPVLLDSFLLKCVNLILKYRKKAGVKTNNEYVFSVPNAIGLKKQYLRACDLLRKFSHECGAVVPTSLRGTTLRKHIATYTAMLGIEETRVSDLANFMGHDKQIHKDVYRVPIPFREMTSVSRLLEAAMGNENESEDEESTDEADKINDESNPDTDSEEVISQSKSCIESSGNPVKDNTGEDFSANTTKSLNNSSSSKRRSTSPYGKTKRSRWTAQEKEAVEKHFGQLATLPHLPSYDECKAAIRKYKVLENRQPQQLKTWINNQRKAKSRKEAYMRRS